MEDPRKLSKKIRKARAHLAVGGWSYRTAAPELGVSFQHLSEVLNGGRVSAALLERILALPSRSGEFSLAKP